MGQKELHEEPPVWYALQTFFQKEQEVEDFLRGKGYEPFIPKLYQERVDRDGKKKRVLLPAVHNLLFLPKDGDGKEQAHVLEECPCPVRVLRHRDTGKLYEIPDKQMTEFRAICDPTYSGTLYTPRAFADERRANACGSFKAHSKVWRGNWCVIKVVSTSSSRLSTSVCFSGSPVGIANLLTDFSIHQCTRWKRKSIGFYRWEG